MPRRKPLTDRQWAARNLRDFQERLRNEMHGRFGYGDHVQARARVARILMPSGTCFSHRKFVYADLISFRMKAHGYGCLHQLSRLEMESVVNLQIPIRAIVDDFYDDLMRAEVPGLAKRDPRYRPGIGAF